MTQSFMAAEVAEIPQAAARFLDLSAQAVREAAAALRRADPGLFVTVARGSSDHAATYLKYAVELLAGVPVASVGPSVASIYRRPLRLEGAACIGISQSGRSPDIVEMMRAAGAGGALTMAITNFADAPMAQASAHCLPLAGGGGTERGGDQDLRDQRSWPAWRLLAEWQEDDELAPRGGRTCRRLSPRRWTLDWSPLAGRLSRAQSLYVLGRGPAFAIASEAALKFKETCGLHAEAYSAAEVLHGPSGHRAGAVSRCLRLGWRMRPCRIWWRRPSGWRRRGRMCS